MRIYQHTDLLPVFRKAVITIGTFDGVHTGHAQILRQLKREADRIDGETVIVTFYPHPRKIVRGGTEEIRMINTLSEKIELLAWQQVDHLVIVPFTEAFSQLTAEQYIKDFLLEKFRPHTVIIGYDHRFGKGRLGDYHLLEQFSQSEGFELQEIPVHLLNAVSVSSTRIREAIGNADIDTARLLLGYDFFFSGRVVEGNKLGRVLGYPTANLRMENAEKLIPGDGIYAVEAELIDDPATGSANAAPPAGHAVTTASRSLFAGPHLKGMMSIGVRPTIGGGDRTIEVNLFDFNEDIYGRELRVFVKAWLRPEVKFDGLEALKTQLAIDKVESLNALNS
ncbi:MAG TPA: bifunctional riboflavin kinase/FMN adenylyltransferase [Puia sp.]|jgi:riboflavin kinase/FMN adenylyltransferase